MYRCLSSPDFKAAPPASPPACLIKEVTKVKEEGTTFFCRLFSRACCSGSSRKRPLGKFRRQKSAAPPYFVAWNSSMLFLGWGKFPTFCFLPPWIKFKRNSEMAASSSEQRRENMRVQCSRFQYCVKSLSCSFFASPRGPVSSLAFHPFFAGNCRASVSSISALSFTLSSLSPRLRDSQQSKTREKKEFWNGAKKKKVVWVTNREKKKRERKNSFPLEIKIFLFFPCNIVKSFHSKMPKGNLQKLLSFRLRNEPYFPFFLRSPLDQLSAKLGFSTFIRELSFLPPIFLLLDFP